VKRYLLDTGLVTAFLFGRPGAHALIAPWIKLDQAATSVLVYAEVSEHIKGRPNFAAHHAALRTLLRAIDPYPLTLRSLDRYGDIRRALRPPYGPGLIGDIDTLIAATALVRNLIVVTLDSDFQRVPELEVILLDRDMLR
jgi:predicted nucleic acid-binding protein